MHGAPAVSYPAGRSSWAGVAILGLWLAGAAGIVLWSVQARTSPGGVAIACALLATSGAIALGAWRRTPAGVLAWDGSSWTWAMDSVAQAGQPEVALDAQRLMLVRWQGEGGVTWLWLERDRQPMRWDDLRRAVYSRATP
jgi:hypothetical protein